MKQLVLFAAFGGVVFAVCRSGLSDDQLSFVSRYCLDCHSGADAEAGLDLENLSFSLDDPVHFNRWVTIHDRVEGGDMPPVGATQPPESARTEFVKSLASDLHSFDAARQEKSGRVQYRRLNRVEYENSLRDLLALPHLEVSEMLPPDSAAHGFDNVGSALAMSYVQMSRYLDASTEALNAAIVLTGQPPVIQKRLEARTNGRFSQVLRKGVEAVPIGDAVGLLRQPNTAQAPWWWSKCDPPADGNYRIRMKSFGFLWDKGEVLPADRPHAVTFHAVQGTAKRPLGTFDVGASRDDFTIHDFEVFLRQGDQIQIWFESLDDRNKGQRPLSEYTAPGVAVEWFEIDGPQVEQWPPASCRALFGDLPLEVWTPKTGLREPPVPMITAGVGKRARRVPARRNRISLYHVVSERPHEDARRLLTDFASRAFRRPVTDAELEDIVALVDRKLNQQYTLQEALRVGFQAILCSPEFLFLDERPGLLEGFALASRLSYFLWSSPPDEILRELAANGTLLQTNVLRDQVERMLDAPGHRRFVENFCGQWLDLRRITITQPDEQLYPEFDSLLLHSMVDETHAFVEQMLADDLSIDHLVDSNFVMINSRLAELYGIPDVEGVAIRKVRLPADSHRGGLLTQASLLKVTANGTTTSPVTRGTWVLDRLLGQPAPLPPPGIPAVEPDLRGTTTIREQLARHRSDALCATCHRRIDPPGFALESYDVIGGWRDRYRSLGEGDEAPAMIRPGRPVRYRLGPAVDPSGVAPNGQEFADIRGFRKVLRQERTQLARNLVQRLLIYGTGAGIQFSDRPMVEQILQKTQEQSYGLRSLIHEVVRSETFRRK